MKRIKIQDGMYEREALDLDPATDIDSPEHKAWKEDQHRRFGTLDGYLAETERSIDSERAAIKARLVELGAVIEHGEAGYGVLKDGLSDKSRREVETLKRQRRDVNHLEFYLRRVRKLREEGDLDATARAAIDLGIAAHKVLARQFELEVLRDRSTDKKRRRGSKEGGAAKAALEEERRQDDAEKYQQHINELMGKNGAIGITQARRRASERFAAPFSRVRTLTFDPRRKEK